MILSDVYKRQAYEKMGEVIDPTMLFLNLDNHVVIDKIVEEVLERKAECILCMDDAVCSRVLKKLREKQMFIRDRLMNFEIKKQGIFTVVNFPSMC